MPTRPGGSRHGATSARATLTALICSAVATIAATAHAQRAGVEYDPFVQGRVRGSIFAGVSASGSETYMQLGLGVGYYLVDGLELGVNSDLWFIGDPTIVNLSPALTYVFHMVRAVKPYVGTFYRHAFVFDAEDLDSVGGRAGLYIVGGHVFGGGGLVYERWLSCSDTRFVDCDEVYPEAAIGFTF
jgi:hypothetical protein